MLDGASAFFWQERMCAEVDGRESSQIAGDKGVDVDGGADDGRGGNVKEDKDLASALRSTQDLFGCPIVYTTITLANSSNNSSTANTTNTNTNANPPPLLQTLPAPLSPLPTSFPTLRLLFSRNAVKRFPGNMGLNALLQDRGARQAVVEKGGFRVDVVPGGSVWSRDENERVGGLSVKERLRGGGVKARGFGFGVGEGGVVFE